MLIGAKDGRFSKAGLTRKRGMQMARHARFTLALLATVFLTAPVYAQFSALTCAPYVHDELKEKVPTFFCVKKEDAFAYIELMEQNRLGKLSEKESRETLAGFRESKECFYVTTSHTSRRTLHQGTETAPYCKKVNFEATKWPSLIEAELLDDGSLIWILTNALVPPVDK